MRDFAFNLDDHVRINANGKDGTVKGLFADAGGEQFSIQYVDNDGCVCERYFRPADLTAL